MEIEYARELRKRIIQVLYVAYDREECLVGIAKRLSAKDQDSTRDIWATRQPHDLFDSNDAELKSINYFFFRPDDTFQTRFETLFDIISTDYEYKDQHTTLQLRATEWGKRGNDAGFLLIDSELAHAQNWLSGSA